MAVDMAEFKSESGVDPRDLCGDEICELIDAGLLCVENGTLRLCDDALFVSDTVFRELV